MKEDYSRVTPEERLDRICTILVRWIYRAEEARRCQDAEKRRGINATATRVYTVSEAARINGISRRTIQRWIRNGTLPVERRANGYPILTNTNLESSVSKNSPLELKCDKCGVYWRV